MPNGMTIGTVFLLIPYYNFIVRQGFSALFCSLPALADQGAADTAKEDGRIISSTDLPRFVWYS